MRLLRITQFGVGYMCTPTIKFNLQFTIHCCVILSLHKLYDTLCNINNFYLDHASFQFKRKGTMLNNRDSEKQQAF